MKITKTDHQYIKWISLAIIIGLALGIAQIFFVYTKTVAPKPEVIQKNPICQSISPECGSCQYERKGNLCYGPSYKQIFRGWPLSNGSYGVFSQTDINSKTYANLLFFAVGLPLLTYLGLKLFKK
jgi:hypothetical protein